MIIDPMNARLKNSILGLRILSVWGLYCPQTLKKINAYSLNLSQNGSKKTQL